MSPSQDDRPRLEPKEERFLERLAGSYAPPPQTPAERVAFDQALAARLQRPTALAGRRWVPPAFAVAAAAGLAWLVIWQSSLLQSPLGGSPQTEEAGPTLAVAGDGVDVWEEELFLSDDLSSAEARDLGAGLPEDYAAIQLVFLGS
ncbi:MAG: hypothetical protein V3T33_00995 [Myxococcota bacterium]